MENRILIAYGTRAGSTEEVAKFIGRVLREAGATVDVLDVKDVQDIRPYQSVVIGSAARNGHLITETMNFARKFRNELRTRPTAYFVVCMTMVEDTPEHRSTVNAYLNPLRGIKEPVSVGLFAGKMDHTKLEPFWRNILNYVKEGPWLGGDFRDWDAICAWGYELVSLLVRDKLYT